MWHHLAAILALSVLCIAWVLFQRWLIKVDRTGRDDDQRDERCGGCGGCTKR